MEQSSNVGDGVGMKQSRGGESIPRPNSLRKEGMGFQIRVKQKTNLSCENRLALIEIS